jgi:hypothetical protein
MASYVEPTTPELQAATTDLRSPTPQQAADKVLSTNELLCGVVTHLPFNDIIAATGVCRSWRDTLVADPGIQETLFLKPAEIRDVLPQNHVDLSNTPIAIKDCTIIGSLHPWLSEICGHVKTGGVYSGGGYSQHPSTNLEFMSCDGLWRKMFVTQPPCKSVTVSFGSNNGPSVKLERNSGIRIGELYDFINEEMSYHPEHFGSVASIDLFDTEEYIQQYERECPNPKYWYTVTRFQVRDGVVCGPPPSSPELSHKDSETSEDSDSSEDSDDPDDSASDHGPDKPHGVEPHGVEPHGVVGYEDYSFEDDDSDDDDEDPNEFADDEADEADQYYQW